MGRCPCKYPQQVGPSGLCFNISKPTTWTGSVALFYGLPLGGPAASESAQEPVGRRFSVAYSPVGLLEVHPMVFKASCFGDSSLRCRCQKLGGPMWGTNSSLLGEKLQVWELPLLEVVAAGGWGSWDSASQPIRPASVWLLFANVKQLLS